MSNATTPPPLGPGSPQDVPPLPGSFPIDPATLPDPIRKEIEAPDPAAIDTSADELKDGVNRCPKCGSTEIRQKPGSDMLICLYCRHEWQSTRVEDEFGLGEGIDQLRGTVVASGARDIKADTASLMTFKCAGCGAEVTVNTANAMTARCHWCRNVLGVNEQIPNGAVPDAVLPFHIKKDDAVARIRQFVDKRRLFALKAFKEQFTPENVVGVYLPYMIVDANAAADVGGQGEIETRRYTRGSGDDKKTYYDADVYQVERHVDFTVDDLPLESSLERGNLDTGSNTNNVINAVLPFDTKNAVKWNASYLAAVRHQERGEVERLLPRGHHLGKARPRRGRPAPAPGGPTAVHRPRPGRSLGQPLRPRRALGTGTPGPARPPLGVDVPAGVAVLLPPARPQRRHAALHRRERPHRQDHGQRARAAVETARHRTHRRHLPRRHRTLARGALVMMSDDSGLWLLALGPAGATALYWALYRYYRNTDKSHAFERETAVEAQPVTGSEQKVGEVKGTQEKRIRGDNVHEYRKRVQRMQNDTG